MLMPAKEWEPLSEWAFRNHWTGEQALSWALANTACELADHCRFVRYSPHVENVPKWVKISKSDQ